MYQAQGPQQPNQGYPSPLPQMQQPEYPQQPYMNQAPQFMPMPTPAPRKPRRWPWIVAILVALMIGYGAGHASAGDAGTTTQPVTTNTSTQPTTAQSQPTQQQQPTGHHKVGENVSVDSEWQVTVTHVSASNGDEITQPKSGHTLLLIDVSLKNISDKQQVASSLIQFSLRDSEGQTYTETILSGKTAPGGHVDAGQPLKGTLVYEVPSSTKTFVLGFIADLGGQQVSWDLQR
ncbi:MAG: DUF4352 domain-containing protein [Ktedonobacteraceae bacterium]|nr:DUF4352 domain-containing protein [Ktedonobacteraceae bacterium]MBO0794788.1 DUF4352 domain-containing protein [Ktedonobacteraceae bacterium]